MKSLANAKFRPLTVVLPIEKIMKESIKMVLEAIYKREYPDTADFSSSPGSRLATLKRIKEQWGGVNYFMKVKLKTSFNNIERHRLIPILKEEIDDPQFFYFIQKVLYPGRLGAKLPNTIPQSVILSVILGNLHLHKFDQEIKRIQQKYQIPVADRIRSVLRTGPSHNQENSGEEESSNGPQDNRANVMKRMKSNQRKAVFASLVSSSSYYHPSSTPHIRVCDQKRPSFSI